VVDDDGYDSLPLGTDEPEGTDDEALLGTDDSLPLGTDELGVADD